jgi:DNA-binding transcriptional ArsR family regulator
MNRINEHLLSYLGSRGACTASELSAAMKISQPTLSRAITSLGQQRIVRIGRARSTRYARRSERPGNECPLYLIDESGQAVHLGVLYELSRGEWHFQQDSPWKSLRGDAFRDGVYPGLPWFLQDMRPCGFLGRCFAHSHAQALQASRNPTDWSDALVLEALRRFGQDMLGALIVGRDMLEQVRSLADHGRESLSETEIPQAYPQMAAQALAGEWPGSSAAGEQPKFTATVMGSGGEIRHVLVKFSGDMKLPESRRWSDLLRAENLANRVLSEEGLLCAQSRIICSAGRTFLESDRFDRCGATGRRAVVSLEALDAAYVGVNGLPWNRAAVALRDAGWLSAADAEHLTLFWWFGMLTGNTDMHYGNISFYLDPNPPLRLAPLYDMVPMFYRPGLEGKLPSDVLKLAPPPPEELPIWRVAADLARKYWEQIAHDHDFSSDFRDIAVKNRVAVSTGIERDVQ